MPGNKVDSLGVPTLNDSIAFYTLWEKAGQQSWFPGSAHIQRFYYVLHASKKCQVTKLIPWECQYWTCVLCFTRFERMPGNKVDSLGVPTFKVSLVFYTLWEDAGQQSWFPGGAHIQRFYCVLHALSGCRVAKLIPGECPHSTCLLCFTRFERMPGNKVDSLGVPAFNVSIVFYTLWVDAG